MAWEISPRTRIGHGIFLSYSGKRDREILPLLQRAIEKQPRRWYRLPMLRVFLDSSGISVGPRLWQKIESGLAKSKWLVVIASPDAAASIWVDREIEWWVANKTADSLLLVVSDGTLEWDETINDWHPERSTALPPRLRGVFTDQPVWKAITWREIPGGAGPDVESAAVSIASVVRGVAEDDLRSEGLRETKRNLRWAQVAVAVLTTLALVASLAAGAAIVQRNRALEQTQIATARLMASVADNDDDTDARTAMLLAAAAYRLDPSSRNLAALFRADLGAKNLVRSLATPTDVTALESSSDGRAVVAGLTDGEVIRWTIADSISHFVTRLPKAVKKIALDATANVIIATDGNRIALYRGGLPEVPVAAPSGQQPDIVAISAGGHVAAIHTTASDHQSLGMFEFIDTQSGRTIETHADEWPFPMETTGMALPSDDNLIVYNSSGSRAEVQIRDWRVSLSCNVVGIGPMQRASGDLSGDGKFFPINSIIQRMPVVETDDPCDSLTHIGFQVPEVNGSAPPVLNHNGSAGAVLGADGVLYVAPVTEDSASPVSAIRLAGAAVSSTDVVRFLGDSTRRLVSAFRNRITLWDLDQIDRLAIQSPLPLTRDCEACKPQVALSANADTAVVRGKIDQNSDFSFDSNHGIVAQTLQARKRKPAEVAICQQDTDFDGIFTWLADNDLAFVSNGGCSANDPPELSDSKLRIIDVDEDVVAAGRGYKPGTMLTVDVRGVTRLRDVTTDRILATAANPFGPLLGDWPDKAVLATINRDGTRVALAECGRSEDADNNCEFLVYDLMELRIIQRMPLSDVTNIEYAGEKLLLRRDRDIEVRGSDGSTIEHRITSQETYVPTYAVPMSTDRAGTIVAHEDVGGLVHIADLRSGAPLADIPAQEAGNPSLQSSVAVSPEGTYLATVSVANDTATSGTATIVIRPISADGLIRTACDRSGGDVTNDEWQQIVGTVRPTRAHCP